ncbi:hypothetical protein FN846DRAFT_902315 [Sphaerosporella brunnea]|uniref:Uncharacterized protein n=1 Tax=Sphaerosporella brunnea TaxID=1250544 RepID=A0A5J5FAB8_9PEZI|nr:hypothetical protein FN846DRAFT_902315 [Sphaerosporella brunnea]
MTSLTTRPPNQATTNPPTSEEAEDGGYCTDKTIVPSTHLPHRVVRELIAWITRVKAHRPADILGFRVRFKLPCAVSRSELDILSETAHPLRLEYTRPSIRRARVTVAMPSVEHDQTAIEVEAQIRQQLHEGGNFYWGPMLGRGIEGVKLRGAQEVKVEEGVRRPDGSLYIPAMQRNFPVIVLEVALSDTFRNAKRKCKMWLRQPGRPIKYAMLVKINKWPTRCVSRVKLTTIIPVVAAAVDESLLDIESEEVDADQLEQAVDQADDPLDADQPDQHRRQTHKFHSVTVSVFCRAGSAKDPQMRTLINQMEVWPAKPSQPWDFSWSEMTPGTAIPEPTRSGRNVISFDFLHELFETEMVRSHCRGDWPLGESDDFPEADPSDLSFPGQDSSSESSQSSAASSGSLFTLRSLAKGKKASPLRERRQTRSQTANVATEVST